VSETFRSIPAPLNFDGSTSRLRRMIGEGLSTSRSHGRPSFQPLAHDALVLLASPPVP
jgi:hypothetical protein